jgi:peptide deformylase
LKLPLHYYGSKVLRTKASPIKEITPEIRQLAHDMIESMHAYNAIGLAAGQVGHPIALFVTCIEPDGTSREGVNRIYINPKILWYSSEKQYESEGCMSIPKCYVYVERPLRIGVEAMDLDGKTFELTLENLASSNFCHENDHLNGVLHIDRIDARQKKEIEGKLRAIKAKYNP